MAASGEPGYEVADHLFNGVDQATRTAWLQAGARSGELIAAATEVGLGRSTASRRWSGRAATRSAVASAHSAGLC